MSITRENPRTIHLGGEGTVINDLAAGAAITPGHLIERYVDTVVKLRPHSTAAGQAVPLFALNQSMLNKGIDDDYASGDLVEGMVGQKGSTFYALIASGQNITAGTFLESAGDGTLKTVSAGFAITQALETVDNSAGPGDARIRVEVI